MVDSYRKLAQTGLLVLCYAGSASQAGVALFNSLVASQLLARAAPYVDASNDLLAHCGQFQVSLVFLCALLVAARPLESQSGAPGAPFRGANFGVGMVFAGCLSLGAAAALVFYETHRADRRLRGSKPAAIELAVQPAATPARRCRPADDDDDADVIHRGTPTWRASPVV